MTTKMIADTKIVDTNTGEVLAEPGQVLDGVDLFVIEMSGLPPRFAPQLPVICPFCGGNLVDNSHPFDGSAFYCPKTDRGEMVA